MPLATPILEWRWIFELEASGSIAPQTGWYPRHLTVWSGDRLVAAAPLYLKTHSQGEFVFDQWWARWAREAGIAYYPKLVGMSPATPAPGYRFLVDPTVDGHAMHEIMFAAIDGYCQELGLSGSHFLFVDPQWQPDAENMGWIAWHHQSFLWQNLGFRTFDDYLVRFKSSQRRNIRRERRQMARQDIRIRAITGEGINGRWADLMHRYYLNTNAQYGLWAARYVNGEFFKGLFQHYRHRLVLFAADLSSTNDEPVALSLLVHKQGRLLGRYWGCDRVIKDLHFNMCFYAPIQWAIENNITAFDPGAGSQHKLYRGFEAVANTSLHRFYHPILKSLFQRFIHTINDAEYANIRELNKLVPFSTLAR